MSLWGNDSTQYTHQWRCPDCGEKIGAWEEPTFAILKKYHERQHVKISELKLEKVRTQKLNGEWGTWDDAQFLHVALIDTRTEDNRSQKELDSRLKPKGAPKEVSPATPRGVLR